MPFSQAKSAAHADNRPAQPAVQVRKVIPVIPMTSLLIGLVAVALVLWRQFVPRPVGGYLSPVVLILAAVGLYSVQSFLQTVQVPSAALAAVAASIALVAVGFGVARGCTVRIWGEDGVAFRQGTWLTFALWLAGLLLHFASGILVTRLQGPAGLTIAAMPLYLAVTLGVQNAVVRSRSDGWARPTSLRC